MASNPIDVRRALKGADYPASREDLIELARENDAPEEIVDELQDNLEDEHYESPAAVMADLGD